MTVQKSAGGSAHAGAPGSRPLKAPSPTAGTMPGVIRTGFARGAIELKILFRNRMELFFTLAFPILLLVLLGSILGEFLSPQAMQLLVTGIVASGVFTVAFYSLTQRIGAERDDGTLHRLGATPFPKASYFVGKTIYVVLAGIIGTTTLIVMAVLLFDLDLPGTAAGWLTLAWALPLSMLAFTLLGIAFSSIVTARNGPVVVLPVYLLLQFISGVFFPFGDLPGWLQTIASVFPLRWAVQGVQAAFLPQSAAPDGDWALGTAALVLGGWILAGLVLSLLTFRWTRTKG